MAAPSEVRKCRRACAKPLSGFSVSVLAITTLLLGACGGGGSGTSSTSPPSGVSMSVSPQSVQASGTTGQSAPTGSFQVLIAGQQPGGQVYVGGKYTSNGIASVSSGSNTTVSPVTVDIQFKSPSTLGPGVYQDQIQVSVCYDQACTEPVTNSPQTVQVTYTVSAGPAGSAVQLNSLLPASAVAGSAAFTLTANGQNFTSQSVVQWNGSPRTTTYVSATQLTAQIAAADIANAGSVPVTVSDPVNGISSPINFTIQAAVLSLTSVSPTAVTVGGAAFTLTAYGQNFTSQSVVQWNGSPRTTTYVSATSLTAQIAAADIATVGSVPVTVSDPVNGNSSPINFTILAALSLTSVSPTEVTVGGPSFMLTVLGAGFTGTSTVQWNGSALPTTLVTSSELIAQVPATDIAALGTAAVTVHDPNSTVGTTPAQTVTIAAASKDAVAFQINPAHSGAVNFASLSFPASAAWSVDVGGTPSYALIVNGMVYVTVTIAGGSSQLLALNQATGATVWGPIVISGAANAAYDSGKIFVISAPSGATAATMEALDAGTGKLLWSTLLAGQYAFSSAPTAANGMVYTGGAGSGGTLYALNEATGAIVWTRSVNNGDDSTPAVTADGVYVVYPYWTYDFRPATGESIWTSNTGGDGGGGGTPVVANQLLYAPNGFGTYDGSVFNAESGANTASYVADNPGAFTANTGYFLQSGTLRGVSLSNSTVQWSFAGDGHLVSSPIAVNQYVFIGSSSGNLYALDGSTGTQVWNVTLSAGLPAGPGWGVGIPLSGLSAGDGLLVVPAGTKVTAYVLSTKP